MLTKKFAALLTLFVLLTPWVCAFEINPLFSDHMVLQRDMPIRIYGSGLPGERLTATFDGRKADATVNSDRSWQVAFPPMPASSRPGTIVVTGKTEKIAIKDVLVGDVWVCSGQSNMGWALWQTIPLPDSYPQASQLRLVKSQTPIAADTPQDKLVIDPDFNNSWQHATKEYADRFSAVSYYFGLNVTRELNVPIGLIEVTLGATGVQCWMPSEPLKSHPDYDVVMAKFKREIEWAKNNAKSPNVIKQYEAKNPSHLYNGMMHPVTRFPIKGMIWYQAENNVQMSDTYRTLFPLAIRSWRKVWGQGDFPFLFVQLPGFYGKTQWHHDKTKHWPDMRLSQEYALKLPNTGMAVTTDSGHYTDIHPKIKNTVGRRLALHAIALEKAGVIADGPIVDKIDKKGDTAFVAFKSVGDGLETRKVILGRSAQDPAEDDDPFVVSSGGLEGFEVSGQDGIFHPANARIVSADRVELKSDKVDDIADIRYAFAAFPLCNLYNSAGLPARPFATQQTAFDFPNVGTSHKYMRMLLENSLSYIDPVHEMTEPVSGYPVEGWNHDPERGLFLRAFTQLTAIGEWLELMANISAGYADNPYLSREQALAQALHITKSLIEDQNNPNISAKGLLVNFLGLENGKRMGPMARDIEKETIVEEFGQSRGEEIWDALLEIEWLKPQRQGQLGIVLRSSEYGTEYFEGPLEPFSDKPTKERIMNLLDRRVAQIIFGDNSNLSACVGKAIGCLLSPSIKDRPEVVKMRRQLEGFLEAQRQGYEYLYDDETDTFIFGWNATDDSFFGWDAGGGRWNIGHMNYFVSEFRAPLLFVVMRFGLSENAIKNSGFKIKSYQMQDGTRKYALAPWSGSAFQGLGLSMFMQELNNPAWKTIMRNFVDIELDFAYRHNLPGFLSESYTGIETQYTGDVGIGDIAVTGKERIIDAPSLYTLGVAYSVAPEKIEKFLADNWPVIETLLTDHGPWEGYNTTQKEIIEYQTTAHTLSLVLGALRTSQANMTRYLNYKQRMPALARLYKPGRAISIIQPTTRIDAWTSDGSAIEAKIVNNTFKMTAPNGIKTGGAKFTLAGSNGVDLSNGLLAISYSSKIAIEEAVIKFVRKESSLIVSASIPNEIFTRFEKTDGRAKRIEIPLPATPGLSGIEAIELNIVDNKTKRPVDLTLQRFEFIPFDTALN